jgi:hypothetical protein
MRSNRRVRLIGFLGVMVAVVVGSHGWASAHPGSHTGLTWICKATQTVTCDYSGISANGRNLNPTHSLSFYSQATGHTNNGSYNMKFVAGDHTSLTDFACENGTIFNGGQNIIASSTGSWSGKGPLLMPAATGTITVCTTPLPGNDSRNFIASSFLFWTVM